MNKENKLSLTLAHLAHKGIVIDFDRRILNYRSDIPISDIFIMINHCLPEDIRDIVIEYEFEPYHI